jgi:DNA-binding CsgD family transcriptional regulator
MSPARLAETAGLAETGGVGTRPILVGRDVERELVYDALCRADRGEPAAVLISGEAGIGKTALVTEVSGDLRGRGYRDFWGRCVRFGAASSSYLPFTQVLTAWFTQATEAERSRVLANAAELNNIAPVLAGDPTSRDERRLLPLLGAVIGRIAAESPLVLVIDDLQWADASSRDALAYLIAGFSPGQQLALAMTYRDVDHAPGHPLHAWVADMRRMPGVSTMRLDRLDLHDTENQVAILAGAQGSPELAARAFAGSGGNPYLTELLLAQLTQRGPHAGGTSKHTSLRQAMLSSWNQLGDASRTLMQLLAVGGRPVGLAVLEQVAAQHGLDAGTVRTSAAEAQAAGLAVTHEVGELWFRHPLLAEVLVGTLDQGAAARAHVIYVRVLHSTHELPAGMKAAHLALHYEGAGALDDAFRWSIRAAAAAATHHGNAEESEHLQRAARLWQWVSSEARAAASSRSHLLMRAGRAAHHAGEVVTALELADAALSELDRAADPVRTGQVLQERWVWQMQAGLDEPGARQDLVDAVELLAAAPDSEQRALALACLVVEDVWNGDQEVAAAHAREAMSVAERSQMPAAQAMAQAAHSQTRWGTTDAVEEAAAALRLARQAGDSTVVSVVGIGYSNAADRAGRFGDASNTLRDVFEELVDAGAGAIAAQIGVLAADHLVSLGRLSECRRVLREVLALRTAPGVSAQIRLAAARLEVRSGRVQAARQHVERAAELGPILTPGIGDPEAVLEVLTAEGEYAAALELAADTLPKVLAVDRAWAGEVLASAATTAATWACHERISVDRTQTQAARRLSRMADLCEGAQSAFGDHADRLLPTVYGAWYAAERARCLDLADQRHRWRQVRDLSERAEMPWEGMLASYRLGEAELARGGDRAEAAQALRAAHATAKDCGATPVQRDIEVLCQQAHIILDGPPAQGSRTSDLPAPFDGLTARERDVLELLVTGKTYAEIASALVISEKTVSTHVSNTLRKTGVRSRIELAALLRDVSAAPTDRG